MAKRKPVFKCFISNSRSAIAVPGSTDSIRCRIIFPEESCADLLPLLFQLRGVLFNLTLCPADLDPKSDFPFLSLASISASSNAIKISGTGGMSVMFDFPGAGLHLGQLIKLREQLLHLEIKRIEES